MPSPRVSQKSLLAPPKLLLGPTLGFYSSHAQSSSLQTLYAKDIAVKYRFPGAWLST